MDEDGITDEMKDIYDEKCKIEISSHQLPTEVKPNKSWTLMMLDIVKQLGPVVLIFGDGICNSCPYLWLFMERERGGGKLCGWTIRRNETWKAIDKKPNQLLFNSFLVQFPTLLTLFCLVLMIFSEGGNLVDFDHKEREFQDHWLNTRHFFVFIGCSCVLNEIFLELLNLTHIL